MKFSWANFIILSKFGRAPLFCLGCKKSSFTNARTNVKCYFDALLMVGVPIYVAFFSGLFAFNELLKTGAVLISLPAFPAIRALLMERLADDLVK